MNVGPISVPLPSSFPRMTQPIPNNPLTQSTMTNITLMSSFQWLLKNPLDFYFKSSDASLTSLVLKRPSLLAIFCTFTHSVCLEDSKEKSEILSVLIKRSAICTKLESEWLRKKIFCVFPQRITFLFFPVLFCPFLQELKREIGIFNRGWGNPIKKG